MPFTPEDLAFIDAGSQLLGQAGNNFAQANLNKKTRQWNEQQYAKQRADNLADWEMNNKYNSPAAQMQRFKEAGLNPNLIYGRGDSGSSPVVKSADTPSWNPRAPEVDLGAIGGSMSRYFNYQMQTSQIDNLHQQLQIGKQEELLKQAQTAQTNVSTSKLASENARTTLEYNIAKELEQTTIEQQKQNLRRSQVETKSAFDENERRAAMQAPNLLTAAENILNMRVSRAKTEAERQSIYQSIENLKKDGKLKDLDIKLKEKGIQPGDNIFFRILAQALGSGSVTDLF